MKGEVKKDELTRQLRIENASELFLKAFDRVMKMRSVEEDLDRAANSLLELGVQPFHLIRQRSTASEPEEIAGLASDLMQARLTLMRKVGSGDVRFEHELDRVTLLRGQAMSGPERPLSYCREVGGRDHLMALTALARSLRSGPGDMDKPPIREGFLYNAYERYLLEGSSGGSRRGAVMGLMSAPRNTSWSYWFDWLYFLFEHPKGPGFHEPPQCMNCGRCLDDRGIQECPGCGEDPWQWWFQWFYSRHPPEDYAQRSWDVFQLHTCTDGPVFHPRTEGWISSVTHIPIQEEGTIHIEVVSGANIAPLGLRSSCGGPLTLDIWHSVGFGPYPATSIRHPVYADGKGGTVEYAHRSPFEHLVLRESLDIENGRTVITTMKGTRRMVPSFASVTWPRGRTLVTSTIDTGEIVGGERYWAALTPEVKGPGVIAVREEVTYILEDPSASGKGSILPSYTGQPGGWFEPLMYRVREEDR